MYIYICYRILDIDDILMALANTITNQGRKSVTNSKLNMCENLERLIVRQLILYYVNTFYLVANSSLIVRLIFCKTQFF